MKLTLVSIFLSSIVQYCLSLSLVTLLLSVINLWGIGMMMVSLNTREPEILVQLSDLKPELTTIRKEAYQ